MDITFTSPFSFLVAAAFADAGGGADGRGTDDGETGPVSGSDGKKNRKLFAELIYSPVHGFVMMICNTRRKH